MPFSGSDSQSVNDSVLLIKEFRLKLSSKKTSEMATLYPQAAGWYMGNSKWGLPEINNSPQWTEEENKRFESALALIDERREDRWDKVAEMIPGKSVSDVINQYKELVADVSSIEAGLFPNPPDYLDLSPSSSSSSSSFTFELMENRSGFDSFIRKRGRTCDQERKKGIPWTQEEHRSFLLGLQAHGKGDWRNISRNFVRSKTPTQVASHAQKYFLRQLSGVKDKKRPSIHDITTVHIQNTSPSSDDNKSPSSEKTSALSSSAASELLFDWNDSNDGLLMAFDSARGNESMGSLFDITSHGHYAANMCTANSRFHIQPTKYVHG